MIPSIVARRTAAHLPSLKRHLVALGEDLRLARLRRRLSATLVAERAGMSRPTLRAIERGEPGVTIGAYASVLHCFGLAQNLELLARDDVLGRKLQDAELTQRPPGRRKPKRSGGSDDERPAKRRRSKAS